jgi:hypothetical protein
MIAGTIRRFFAAGLVSAIALSPGVATAQWSADDQTVGLAQMSTAWDEIETNPRAALRIFEQQLPRWAAFSKQSVGYIDALRGSLVAAVIAHDDSAARAAWQRIDGGSSVIAATEPLGDTLAARGEWRQAFRSYRRAGDFGTPACTVTTNRGLDRAAAGFFRSAIGIWSAQAECLGPDDVSDVQLALTGDAFAARNDWRDATAQWIRAARYRRNVPQIAALDVGNLMALSMLYHHRRRIV